jgi:hypothetical protein
VYKGTSAALTDLLGGHIDMLFGDPSIMPSIKAGQLHALIFRRAGFLLSARLLTRRITLECATKRDFRKLSPNLTKSYTG